MITRIKAEEILNVLIQDTIDREAKTLEKGISYWERFEIWSQTAKDCLEQIYGPNHRNLIEFTQIRFSNLAGGSAQLVTFIVGLRTAREKLIATRFSVQTYWGDDVKASIYPIVFISCSEKSRKIADKLKYFLTSLGARAIFVSDEPSLNLSVEDKVKYYMSICNSGIAVLTADDTLATGEKINKRNIDNELGLMEKSSNINNRIIVLKESGVNKASNTAEKVHISFKRERFGDDVYPSLVKELRAFGFL